MRLEISGLKTVFGKTSAPHCSSGFFTLKIYLLNYVLENLERFWSLAFTDEAPSVHLDVLIEQSYRMSFCQYSTKIYDTVHNVGRALESVEREKSQIQELLLAHPY